jgi:hypothetical protein
MRKEKLKELVKNTAFRKLLECSERGDIKYENRKTENNNKKCIGHFEIKVIQKVKQLKELKSILD